MKTMTQFEKWFKAQFGKLPRQCRKREDVNRDLAAANEKVYHLKKELEIIDDIQIKFEAAMYTRTAAEKKFQF